MKYFIVFIISVLMGMGVGGGGLFVLYLTLFLNYEQICAQGTNLIYFFITGISALFFHFKKRKIVLLQLLPMVVFGLLGSVFSSAFASRSDPKILRYSFSALLIVSGSIGIFNIIKNYFKKKRKKSLQMK